MKQLWLTSFFLCIFLHPAHALQDPPDNPLEFEPPWELIETRDHIKIYKHPWPYKEIETYKVDTIIAAPRADILSFITNIDAYSEWIPNFKTARTLRITKQKTIIYYMAIDLPWPASDRDWVNELTVIQNKNNSSVTITFMAYDHFFPKQTDYIRVTDHLASWTLISIDENQTRSIWQWYTDPGGRLPDWLINWASRSQVIESLHKIKKRLEK